VRAERDIAEHDGGAGEVNAPAELRLAAEKFVELGIQFSHGPTVTEIIFLTTKYTKHTKQPGDDFGKFLLSWDWVVAWFASGWFLNLVERAAGGRVQSL
jgi:hypothetical protein